MVMDRTEVFGLTLLQFQQMLLSQENRALCPKKTAAEADDSHFSPPMDYG